MECPWSFTAEEFTRRVGRAKTSEVLETSEVWKDAHEETVSVTEDIVRVEKEIDEWIKGLYGL
jgi:hypothetical protein